MTHTQSEITAKAADSHSGPTKDLTVQGERKDLNTIFIKLRITDSTGNCRNIHFPFDIEADTSIAVASEMVHELDLTDQDIPTIADMIDSEIRALIPDWSPRDSSMGESTFDGQLSDSKDESSPLPLLEGKDDSAQMASSSPFSGGSFYPDQLPSGRKFWSDSPRAGGGLSPIKSTPVSPSGFGTTEDPMRVGSSGLHEESHEVTREIPTAGDKLAENIHATECGEESVNSKMDIFPECVQNGEFDKVKKEGGVSDIDTDEGSTIADKLQKLLVEQQKEMDKLQQKHELVVFNILRELSPQMRIKVFNICRRKIPDCKLQSEMNVSSGHATPSVSVNISSGLSAKRIFTRSLSTFDLTVGPRIPQTPTNLNLKKQASSDGIAVILENNSL